jgi:transposase
MKGGEKGMNYIGMDIHKEFTVAIAKDRDGKLLAKDKFINTKNNFEKFFKDFPPKETLIVMESTSVWEYIYEILEEMGYDVKLANPVKTRAIAEARIKTDSIDADTLCDLLRANLVAECYIHSKETRQIRELVRGRKTFEKQGTQIKNRIHAILIKKGLKIPTEGIGSGAMKYLLETQKDNYILVQYIEELKEHGKRTELIERKIREVASENSDAVLLMGIPGIAEIRALEIVTEIGDIERFPTAEKLCSYAGLVPGIKQSGSTLIVGRLVKQASMNLKHVLIEASWSLIRHKGKNRYREFYEKLAKKKSKQKAICAVARKLCCTIHAILRKKQQFILL